MSSTSWRGRELLGSQTPRVWYAPSADTSAGAEAVRLGELAGLEPMPWQRFVCEHALAQRVTGGSWSWAAFEVLLLVPRQNGKGTCIELVELYALFALGLNVYHTAQLMETSRKAAERLWLLIDRTPQLRRRVRDVKRTADKITIELTNGAHITFMARSSKSGRGFDDANVLIFDEAMFLEPRMTEAIIPTLSTRETPLVIYASSAGLAGSVLLRRLRRRVVEQGAGITGFDWSIDPRITAEPGFDPLAVEVVAQANPSLGALITMDYVRGEYAALTTTPEGLQGYLRERLGVFDDDPAAAKRVFSATAWAARGGATAPPTERIAFGVAAAWPDAESASIAVTGWLGDELVVQVVQHGPGTGWVLPRLRELVDRHGAPVVIDPGGPAGFLLGEIADERLDEGQRPIEVLTPTMREIGYAAKALLVAVAGDRPYLRHFGQPELDAAAMHAGRRPLGDSWTLQRRGDVDISPLEAVKLAAWGSSRTVPAPPAPVALPHGDDDELRMPRIDIADLTKIGF